MKAVLAVLLLSLVACGTTDSFKNSEDTDYVIASQSQAGGIYKLIRGSTSLCKLSKHGVIGLEYTIEFKNGECVISAVK